MYDTKYEKKKKIRWIPTKLFPWNDFKIYGMNLQKTALITFQFQ